MADGMLFRARRAEAGAISPLLAFLAGPHAGAIAAVWPAPHEGFFVLSAARRHAAAILLARGRRDPEGLRALLERRRDGDIASALCGSDVPGGLMKALGRAGETLWAAPDYERFLSLFAGANSGRVMRHMERIEPGQLAVIAALPPRLREARVVANVRELQAARDLALAMRLVARINGEAAADRLVQGALAAKSAQALFDRAAAALQPERFSRPAPPPVLPAHLAPVESAAELERVALDFRNCLRDFASDLVNGRMAVWVRRSAPQSVFALRWDPAGWRLAEAEAPANEELPEPVLIELVDLLAAHDVRTGVSSWTLANRLRRHTYGGVECVGESFRDQLELGELWD